MPASKEPEETYSHLLQARVLPRTKRAVDKFISERKEITRKYYGYPDFLRDAIDLFLEMIDPNPEILKKSAIEKVKRVMKETVIGREVIAAEKEVLQKVTDLERRIRIIEEEKQWMIEAFEKGTLYEMPHEEE